jgi:hypothetical protein
MVDEARPRRIDRRRGASVRVVDTPPIVPEGKLDG